MEKNQIALFLTAIVGMLCFIWFQTSIYSSSTEYYSNTISTRAVDPTIKRDGRGVPLKGNYSDHPIVKWDSSKTKLLLKTKAENFGKVASQNARSFVKSRRTSDGALDYKAINEIFGEGYKLYFQGKKTPQNRLDGRYLLFVAANGGEAYALYNLSFLYDEENANPDEELATDLLRMAADKDHVPAIINLTNMWNTLDDDFVVNTKIESVTRVKEAYLRRGFDLDAEDGGYFIALTLAEFYLSEAPNYRDDGYFERALKRLETLSPNGDAWEIRGRMHDFAIRLPKRDTDKALIYYLKAAQQGNLDGILGAAVFLSNEGRSLEEMKRAKALYLLGLKIDPTNYIFMNHLGSLVGQKKAGETNIPLRAAFFRRTLHWEKKIELRNKISELSRKTMKRIIGELTPEQAAVMERYEALLSENKFNEIESLAKIPNPF